MRTLIAALSILAIACGDTTGTSPIEVVPIQPVATTAQAEVPTAAAQEPAPAAYVCPMCDGVESDKPGDCPTCGMDLVPAAAEPSDAAAIHVCPMHPEVRQEGPGSCPTCGMDLVPADGNEAAQMEHGAHQGHEGHQH